MEDLSMRCIQINPDHAPSVSYLSMIENGKRVPSEYMLEIIARVFQKEPKWFLDEVTDQDLIVSTRQKRGGIHGVALEPEFLFSKQHLQSALPEMLSQTGTSGDQFAHLLIRAHQEYNQNNFPDLEKAAEAVGKKQMPLSLNDTYALVKKMGVEIKWFNRDPEPITNETNKSFKTLVRSFYEPPGVIYINKALQQYPERLKFDLATHIGHYTLYGKDGLPSMNAAGHGLISRARDEANELHESMTIDSNDILQAWRDFECSSFASALLCPKPPFKQHLNRHAYAIDTNSAIGVSPSVYMRRMTSVSPYPHWHYFDAYTPDRLKTIYRGNGIPLPIGNMRPIQDPCPHWSLFRVLMDESATSQPRAQISILRTGDEDRIYSCDSIKTRDMAGNPHVLCVGIELNPAIESQDIDPREITEAVKTNCQKHNGEAPIPQAIKKELTNVSKILNITWIERGLDNNAILICPRGSLCPRDPKCFQKPSLMDTSPKLADIRQQIIQEC
ncbi:MerR family transcriptional regulator [Candidatus Endobugula sertula]|uniref:MerR family transcriptional regulator n=1 Tax=Candidatus Endobugula sertula TaxID=62101 RepID=A0A1D2QLK3_9GAMM|nr:MerR family transcriptional regulator [Candidatus Endobugula sertula]